MDVGQRRPRAPKVGPFASSCFIIHPSDHGVIDEGLEAGGGLVKISRASITHGDVEPRVEVLLVMRVFLRGHDREVAPRM